MEKSSLEQLDSDDGEDEVEEHVDDHDVDDVLERVDNAVEHRLAHTHHTRPAFIPLSASASTKSTDANMVLVSLIHQLLR